MSREGKKGEKEDLGKGEKKNGKKMEELCLVVGQRERREERGRMTHTHKDGSLQHNCIQRKRGGTSLKRQYGHVYVYMVRKHEHT